MGRSRSASRHTATLAAPAARSRRGNPSFVTAYDSGVEGRSSARASCGAVADVELAVDVAEVGLDRLRAEEERVRDALVRLSLGDHGRDLHLLRRSARRFGLAVRVGLDRRSSAARARPSRPMGPPRALRSSGARRAGAGARRPGGRRVVAVRPSTARSVRARTARATRRTSRCASAKTASAVSGEARRPWQRAAAASAHAGRSAAPGPRTRRACCALRSPDRPGSGSRSGRASTAPGWARRFRMRSASSRVRDRWAIAASGRSRPSSSSPRPACGVHLQRPTAAASGDRRHEVGVGACAVGVAGHRVEQQQLDVPEMQELVGVLGESERLLGVRSGSDPVADPVLELAEGAQHVRQVADETPVARDRDRRARARDERCRSPPSSTRTGRGLRGTPSCARLARVRALGVAQQQRIAACALPGHDEKPPERRLGRRRGSSTKRSGERDGRLGRLDGR